MSDWIKRQWCSWTHGGGDIKRDNLRRINWQCRKCGRWADPVSLDDERNYIYEELLKRKSRSAMKENSDD